MDERLRAAMHEADGAGAPGWAEDDPRGTTFVAAAEHPVCGDLLELSVLVEPGRGEVVDLAWRADGCPATLAVASLARGCLRGRPLAEAGPQLRSRVGGGLARAEGHALAMMLRAIDDVETQWRVRGGGGGPRDG